jgi:hypothetical protein
MNFHKINKMDIEDIIRDIDSEKFITVDEAGDYIYSEYNGKRVAEDLNIDRHRWYEISTIVYKIAPSIYIGLRGISNIYSDTMDYDSLDYVRAFEMEPIQAITYKAK